MLKYLYAQLNTDNRFRLLLRRQSVKRGRARVLKTAYSERLALTLLLQFRVPGTRFVTAALTPTQEDSGLLRQLHGTVRRHAHVARRLSLWRTRLTIGGIQVQVGREQLFHGLSLGQCFGVAYEADDLISKANRRLAAGQASVAAALADLANARSSYATLACRASHTD